jgi:hypothetical protein
VPVDVATSVCLSHSTTRNLLNGFPYKLIVLEPTGLAACSLGLLSDASRRIGELPPDYTEPHPTYFVGFGDLTAVTMKSAVF